MVSESSFPFAFTINPPPLGQCAGGTHPTGMHSCLKVRLISISQKISPHKYGNTVGKRSLVIAGSFKVSLFVG